MTLGGVLRREKEWKCNLQVERRKVEEDQFSRSGVEEKNEAGQCLLGWTWDTERHRKLEIRRRAGDEMQREQASAQAQ